MNGQHTSESSGGQDSGPFTSYVDPSFKPPALTSPHHHNKHHKHFNVATDLAEALRLRDTKRLKSLLRSHHWCANDGGRSGLWYKVCCAVHKEMAQGISIYKDMVTRVFGEGDTAHDATLPAFIDITTLEHYHLNQSGVQTARRVVCILEQECPDITYAPLLFANTCLLLHYMGEEDAYNALCAMLRSKERYLSQTKISHDATKYVLKDLARKHAKGCYQHIIKQGMVVEGVLARWIWWIYKDLPFTYLVRVMDCYLLEGPKVLYRVALAIMQLFYKIIVKGGEASKQDPDIGRAISLFCEEMTSTVTCDKLLKVAFGIRGLSKKDVMKLQIHKEMFVRSKINVSYMSANMPTSPSVESLSVKVKRSHSGPISMQDINSALLNLQQSEGRVRSSSQGAMGMSVIKAKSSILHARHWQDVYGWLPSRWALLQPRLLFSTAEHGTSLTTFYNKVDGYEPTLMVLRSTDGDVFGAFCSMDWTNRKKSDRNLSYFGNGEMFLFQFTPCPKRYNWVGMTMTEQCPAGKELFMAGDMTQLQIGGGGGIAIHIDQNFHMCYTQHCDTFNNPPLIQSGNEFTCGTLEVFCFEQAKT